MIIESHLTISSFFMTHHHFLPVMKPTDDKSAFNLSSFLFPFRKDIQFISNSTIFLKKIFFQVTNVLNYQILPKKVDSFALPYLEKTLARID